jgi:NAD(P)-dependent dehydrogenase (short-subunit alcohol dehydrogenase family)
MESDRDQAVTVVTGAGSGVGRATVLALAERGARVLCVGRRLHLLDETVALSGANSFAVDADVGTDEGISSIVAALDGAPVKALIHCAAVEGVHDLASSDRGVFDELIAINLAGPFLLTRALQSSLPSGSAVVFVGSISAHCGRTRHAAYAASKAGLHGLTKSLAVELAPHVRVNCVDPGGVQTAMLTQTINDFVAGLDGDQIQQLIDAERGRLLLERVADPQEVAKAIVFLALDASYCTGTVLTVDGGYTAH